MSLRNDLRTYLMDIRSSGQFNSALAKLLKSTTGGATDFREPGKAPSTQQGNSNHQYKLYISFITAFKYWVRLYIIFLLYSQPQLGVETVNSQGQRSTKHEKELLSYCTQASAVKEGLPKTNR